MTTDHTREADTLFGLLFAHQVIPAYDGHLSHHRCLACGVTTNGGPNSPDNVRHIRDVLLASPWLAAHVAAAVDVAVVAERERIGAAIEALKQPPRSPDAYLAIQDAARIARSTTDGGDTRG